MENKSNNFHRRDFWEKHIVFLSTRRPQQTQAPSSAPQATPRQTSQGRAEAQEVTATDLSRITLPPDRHRPKTVADINNFKLWLSPEHLPTRIQNMDILNISREYEATRTDIDLDAWDTSTERGLKMIFRDFQRLKIPINEFKNQVFSILNHGVTNEAYRRTEEYIAAKSYIDHIKRELIQKWEIDHIATQESARDATTSGTSKVTDFVKSNVQAITKAFQEGDYVKLGLMAAGGLVLFKVISGIWKSAEGADSTLAKTLKWGILAGGAGLAVHFLAKNAGYDVLGKIKETVGLTEDIADMQLNSINRAIETIPNSILSEDNKKLDGSILKNVSGTNLTTLENLRREGSREKSIDPNKFHLYKDLPRGSNEWKRVGKEIYKIAIALRHAYQETLQKRHNGYKNVSYEDAIRRPDLRDSNIRHLATAITPFIQETRVATPTSPSAQTPPPRTGDPTGTA